MNQVYKYLLLLFLLIRIFISFQGFSGDINNHISWGKSAYEHGFSSIYHRYYPTTMQPTYPPLALYFFYFEYWLFEKTNQTVISLNKSAEIFPSKLVWFFERPQTLPAFMKIQSILADIGISILIYKLVSFLGFSTRISQITSLFWLANPSVIHNSSYWGQLEALPLLMLLGSLYFLAQKKAYLSHTFFALALLSKQSALVFIPIYLFYSYRQVGITKSVKAIFVQLLVFITLYIPVYGVSPAKVVSNYQHIISVGSGSDYITDHAFNFWAPITNLQKISDSRKLFFFSAKSWGYLLSVPILVFSLIALARNKSSALSLFLNLAIFPLTTFVFFTRMHERYLQASLLGLLLTIPFLPKNIILLIILSISYFSNLYHNWEVESLVTINSIIRNITTINALSVANLVVLLVLLWQTNSLSKRR